MRSSYRIPATARIGFSIAGAAQTADAFDGNRTGQPCARSRVALRHVLRALASELATAGIADRRLTHLRPLVDAEHARLLEQLDAGGAIEDYMRGRARLADNLVVGLFHLARVCVGADTSTMVPPLAALAVGDYGRCRLARRSTLGLLFLHSNDGEARSRAERMVAFVVAALLELGFQVEHALLTPNDSALCVASSLAANLRDMRFLWGCYGVHAQLAARLEELHAVSQ